MSSPMDLTELKSVDWPELLTRPLEDVGALQAIGGRQCTICDRPFALARVEWVEWWGCMPKATAASQTITPMPFLRRGCIWNCLPRV